MNTMKTVKDEQYWMKMAIGGFLAVVIILFFYLQRTHRITPPAPEPTPTPVPVSSANITVFSPESNKTVPQVFQIQGKARVFENVVSYRVINKITGVEYDKGTAMTNAMNPGTYGDFTITVHLSSNNSLKSGDNILIEIFQASPKDGSEVDKVTIPEKFIPL